uniref:Fe2OG dioxygenase domain-containing protein n=1 Tax=Pyrodinium bahamense TaxID=73915 RepID=A0A7S0FUH1_9DINO
MEERVLPYIRERYACPDCAVADILVRRYLPGERRTHAVHFDGHAFVTAVLGLSDPDEYEGGLYVQPGADVASRTFFRIEPGDLVVHSFDLQHGVHVWKGIRYSLIFWVKDSSQAVREHTTPWYDELAERGDADALYALALNYSNGSSGKTLDIVKAIELYERSARVGHHFAQNNLGTLYKKAHKVMGLAGGLEKSVGWLRAAAEAGFAMAQKNLALAYAMGEGVERDEAEAAKWMRRSAEQLDVESAHLLGEMCREGRGVPRDLGEAARWYRRSAKAGFPRAQYTLGILHLEGQGVVRDQEKAEAWFRYAAKQGVPEAKNNVAALAAQRGDVQEAANIWSDLAAGGEPNAQCNLGMCYMRGLGRDRDVQRAREWLGKAAAQGHRMAQHALVQL